MATSKIINIEPAVVDEKGMIANILEEPISHVAIITSKAGSVRGNHYHPEQVQYVYLVSGRYEDITKDLNDKNSKTDSKIIEPGNLVIMPPMVAHAMRFLEDSVFLNLTTGDRKADNYNEHTKKFKLI